MGISTGVMSNYLETSLLNYAFRGIAFTPPTAYYVTLYSNTTGAGEADTGTEVTTGGYSIGRVSISLPSQIRILNNSIYNLQTLTFTEATYAWGTMYGWGIKDEWTGGNLLFWGLFDSAPTINAGDRLRISASQLYITAYQATSLFGGWTTYSANIIWEYLINGTPFNWITGGTYLALGNTVALNNTTDNLFSSWVEISTLGTGYGRIPIPNSVWSGADNGDNILRNTYDISFTENATANWGTVSDIVLYDSAISGNPIFWGHLAAPITVNSGDGFRIAAGTIQIQFN